MNEKAVTEKARRSKRQAGLDVSHVVSLTTKKQKKNCPKKNVELQSQHEELEQHTISEEVEQEPETVGAEEDEKMNKTEKKVNPSSETQTQKSDNQVKKTRGPTKMRKVAKHIEDKVDVEFNSVGEHVGRGSVTMSSFLGPLVREHVPVLLDDWRHLEEKTKDVLWEEIQVIVLSIHTYC
ncbi:hypothetical protein Bca4012_025601 [Brassica carinata]